MTPDKKITDEQLKEEIRKGRTQKQIAEKHGYGYPSASLTERCQKLGYTKNRLKKVREDGGLQLYLKKSQIKEMMENSGVDFIEKDGEKYFAYEIIGVNEEGILQVKPREEAWRKTE